MCLVTGADPQIIQKKTERAGPPERCVQYPSILGARSTESKIWPCRNISKREGVCPPVTTAMDSQTNGNGDADKGVQPSMVKELYGIPHERGGLTWLDECPEYLSKTTSKTPDHALVSLCEIFKSDTRRARMLDTMRGPLSHRDF